MFIFFIFSLISTKELGLTTNLVGSTLTLTLSFILLQRLGEVWLFNAYYVLIVLSVFCFIPVIYTYHVVSPAMIGAGLSTNLVEITEFLRALNTKSILLAIGYLVFAILTFLLIRNPNVHFVLLAFWGVSGFYQGIITHSLPQMTFPTFSAIISFIGGESMLSQSSGNFTVYSTIFYIVLTALCFRFNQDKRKPATVVLWFLFGVLTFYRPMIAYYVFTHPSSNSSNFSDAFKLTFEREESSDDASFSPFTASISRIYPFTFSTFPPLRVSATYFNYIRDFRRDEQKLAKSKLQNTWEILSSSPKYKNYVVVIGESVRRDYLSLYGYPLSNTPFLDKVNGTFWLNYISPEGATLPSLLRMFIRNQLGEFDYGKSIVGMANKAGFDTFWISNQGFMGRLDTPITMLAKQTKHSHFINQLDWTFTVKSDWQVLTPFKQLLEEKTDKPKLIFVHIMGSHPKFCLRVSKDFGITPITGQVNKEISCYLTSIKQTDKLLSQLYQDLQQTGQSFSLMYFADHGLKHSEKGTDDVSLVHGDTFQSDFTVPMMVLSSDDTSRHFIQAYKSGFDFAGQFAEWLGIQAKDLQDSPVKFFDESSPKTIYVINKKHKFAEMKPDPVILPQEKK